MEDYTSGTTITILVPGTGMCIDFTDLLVNDDIALEGDEAFTIFIDGTPSVAMVTITESDGESNTYTILIHVELLHSPLPFTVFREYLSIVRVDLQPKSCHNTTGIIATRFFSHFRGVSWV